MDQFATFVHVVLFKLPPNADPEEAGLLIHDIQSMLSPLPGVEAVRCGTPADTKRPDRPMVDTDYDVGLFVLFKSLAALEGYLAHPQHEAFAERWDTRCELRVFDFEPAAG